VVQSISLSAQNVDSLWGIWNDQQLEDSSRLNALCIITTGLVEDLPDSANVLADIILEMANKSDLNEFKAKALQIKGQYFQNIYEYEKALKYYQSSLSILEDIQAKPEMAILFDKIGTNYLKQYAYQEAQEYYQKGLTMSMEIGNSTGIAEGNTSLGVYYYYQGDFTNSLDHFQLAMEIYMELEKKEEIADMYTRIGAIYYHQGHYTKAIQYINKYFEYDKEGKNMVKHAELYTNLGAIYFQQQDYLKAKEFYKKGLTIDSTFNDQRGIAIGNYNIGECFLELNNLPISLEYFRKCISISQEYKEKDLIADCYLKIGLIYQIQGEYTEAGKYYQESLNAANDIGYNSILSSIYTYQGNLFNILSDHQKAANYCLDGLKLSNESGDIIQQISACKCLYKSYKALGNAAKALEYHEIFLALSDSLHKDEAIRQLQQLEFDQQVLADSLIMEEEKLIAEFASQREISKQKSRKNIFMFGGIGILVLAIGLYSRLSYIKKSRTIIQKEKDISENLLLNILPSEVAEELKLKGESIARNFESVSVLFSDFKGFTNISENLNAQELVAEINTCFKAFDEIITSYGIEKIKTIGDAYMAAGGLNAPKTSTIRDVLLAGLDMQSFMEARKLELQNSNKPFFEMRLGIHTGQVVAGIVGVKKFQYDIWGDTVNIAHSMESSGDVGKVNISENTYNLIKEDPDFIFESRGKIQAKNKGDLEMYFVERNNSPEL